MIQGQLFSAPAPARPTAGGNRLWAARVLRSSSVEWSASQLRISTSRWRQLESGEMARLRPFEGRLSDLFGFQSPWWRGPLTEIDQIRTDASGHRQRLQAEAAAQAIAQLSAAVDTGPSTRPESPPGGSGIDRAQWMLQHWRRTHNLYQATVDLGYRLWALGTSQRPPLWLHVNGPAINAIATTSHPNPTVHRVALINALTALHTSDLPTSEQHAYWAQLTATTTPSPTTTPRHISIPNVHRLEPHVPHQRPHIPWHSPIQSLPTPAELHQRTGIPKDLLPTFTLSYHNTPQGLQRPTSTSQQSD